MATEEDLQSNMRMLNTKSGGKDMYLMLHQCYHHLSSTLNVNFDLFLTTLHQATLISQTVFKKQGVIVVTVIELEALFCLLEPLLHRWDGFLWRQSRNNTMIDLLHEEIIEWEAQQGLGAGGRGIWMAPLYYIREDDILEGGGKRWLGELHRLVC